MNTISASVTCSGGSFAFDASFDRRLIRHDERDLGTAPNLSCVYRLACRDGLPAFSSQRGSSYRRTTR